MNNSKIRSIACSLGLALVLLGGCDTTSNLRGDVDTDTFQLFTASIIELQQGTDQALRGLVEKSAAGFKARLAEEIQDPHTEYPESILALSDMAFGLGDDVFSMENAPYFADIPAFKLAMYRSNEALKSYAEFLATLADPGLLGSQGQAMQQLKEELNVNMAAAMSGLNPDISPANQGAVAIFSDLAGSLLERHLQNYQKATLVEMIQANQAGVAGFVAHMQEGVRILARAHNEEFEIERTKLLMVAANAELASAARIKAALELVDLVQAQISLIEVLLKLHTTYGELPAVHLQLARLEGGESSGLGRIISFAEQARHLNQVYDETVSQARQQRLQSRKDEADALATSAEVSASRTAVEVAELQLEIASLNQAVENDPDNTAQAAQLSTLQVNLETLQQELQRQTDRAMSLRQAATAVGAAIDELGGQFE